MRTPVGWNSPGGTFVAARTQLSTKKRKEQRNSRKKAQKTQKKELFNGSKSKAARLLWCAAFGWSRAGYTYSTSLFCVSLSPYSWRMTWFLENN